MTVTPAPLLLLVLAAAAPAQDQACERPARPNVLLLLADDASVRSLGFSGGPSAVTPNLDGLAAGGVVMDGAVHQGGFSGAICAVSRAMLLTGRPVWGVCWTQGSCTRQWLRALPAWSG